MTFSRIVKPLRAVVALGLGALGSFATVAHAQDTLRLSHVWPANHYIQTELLQPFMDSVIARTEGALAFQAYPAGQLGKDVPGLVNSNLVDIGVFTTAGHVDKFPLSSVSELPLSAATACEGSRKMNALALPGGLLDQSEWAPQGLRVLSAHMLAPYALFLKGGAASVDDIAGKKIWTSGPTADIGVRSMGGVSIHVPSTELYDTASRGTIDGFILAETSTIQYELAPLIKASVADITFGAGTFYITMRLDAWEDLDPSVQTALSEEAQRHGELFCAYVDERTLKDRATIAAMPGFVVHTLGEAEKAEFETRLTAVGELWATTFDKAGLKGSEVLESYRGAVSH